MALTPQQAERVIAAIKIRHPNPLPDLNDLSWAPLLNELQGIAPAPAAPAPVPAVAVVAAAAVAAVAAGALPANFDHNDLNNYFTAGPGAFTPAGGVALGLSGNEIRTALHLNAQADYQALIAWVTDDIATVLNAHAAHNQAVAALRELEAYHVAAGVVGPGPDVASDQAAQIATRIRNNLNPVQALTALQHLLAASQLDSVNCTDVVLTDNILNAPAIHANRNNSADAAAKLLNHKVAEANVLAIAAAIDGGGVANRHLAINELVDNGLLAVDCTRAILSNAILDNGQIQNNTHHAAESAAKLLNHEANEADVDAIATRVGAAAGRHNAIDRLIAQGLAVGKCTDVLLTDNILGDAQIQGNDDAAALAAKLLNFNVLPVEVEPILARVGADANRIAALNQLLNVGLTQAMCTDALLTNALLAAVGNDAEKAKAAVACFNAGKTQAQTLGILVNADKLETFQALLTHHVPQNDAFNIADQIRHRNDKDAVILLINAEVTPGVHLIPATFTLANIDQNMMTFVDTHQDKVNHIAKWIEAGLDNAKISVAEKSTATHALLQYSDLENLDPDAAVKVIDLCDLGPKASSLAKLLTRNVSVTAINDDKITGPLLQAINDDDDNADLAKVLAAYNDPAADNAAAIINVVAGDAGRKKAVLALCDPTQGKLGSAAHINATNFTQRLLDEVGAGTPDVVKAKAIAAGQLFKKAANEARVLQILTWADSDAKRKILPRLVLISDQTKITQAIINKLDAADAAVGNAKAQIVVDLLNRGVDETRALQILDAVSPVEVMHMEQIARLVNKSRINANDITVNLINAFQALDSTHIPQIIDRFCLIQAGRIPSANLIATVEKLNNIEFPVPVSGAVVHAEGEFDETKMVGQLIELGKLSTTERDHLIDSESIPPVTKLEQIIQAAPGENFTHKLIGPAATVEETVRNKQACAYRYTLPLDPLSAARVPPTITQWKKDTKVGTKTHKKGDVEINEMPPEVSTLKNSMKLIAETMGYKAIDLSQADEHIQIHLLDPITNAPPIDTATGFPYNFNLRQVCFALAEEHDLKIKAPFNNPRGVGLNDASYEALKDCLGLTGAVARPVVGGRP